MNKSNFAIVMAGCLLPYAVGSHASALGELAAKMAPGDWAELKTTGYSTSLITTGTDNILNYSNSAVWDPVKKEVRFVGQGHNEAEKMIIYTEEDNTWKNQSGPNTSGIGHGYDHNALDPATGISYYRKFASSAVFQYDGAWKTAPSLEGTPNSNNCCGSLTWFPEMNALTFWGSGYVDVLKNGKWSVVATKQVKMGDYHNVSEYSSQYGLVFGGAGNDDKNLYALNAAGTLTAIPPAPVSMGIYSALVIADPGSGELVVVSRDKTIWSYHPGIKTWAQMKAPTVNLFVNEDIPIKFMVASSISTYNVIMFIKKDAIYLYKHKMQAPVSIKRGPQGLAPKSRPKHSISLGGTLPGLSEWATGYRDPSGRLRSVPVSGGMNAAAGLLLPVSP